MTNRMYVKGRNFEYKTMHHLKAEGFIPIRAAGSHGPFDVIGLRSTHPVLLIQCKVVEKSGQGKALIEKFRNKPPMNVSEYGSYQQQLRVYIQDTRESLQVTV